MTHTKKQGDTVDNARDPRFISKNPTILVEILELRHAGFSFKFIADIYNCDRTSLRYHCRKYQIFPIKTVFIRNDKSSEIFNPERIVSNILITFTPSKESKWFLVDGERINAGKNYKDYIRELSPYKHLGL